MNSADQQLVNTLEQLIASELHDNYQHWISWATQLPPSQHMEVSSEGLAFIVDYMVEQMDHGEDRFLADLEDDLDYSQALEQWTEERFGETTYSRGGHIWLTDQQGQFLFDLFEKAIRNISKRELTRGI